MGRHGGGPRRFVPGECIVSTSHNRRGRALGRVYQASDLVGICDVVVVHEEEVPPSGAYGRRVSSRSGERAGLTDERPPARLELWLYLRQVGSAFSGLAAVVDKNQFNRRIRLSTN